MQVLDADLLCVKLIMKVGDISPCSTECSMVPAVAQSSNDSL